MRGTGSGSQRAPSSTSSSGSTPLLPLARRQTKMETTSSKNILVLSSNDHKCTTFSYLPPFLLHLCRKYLPLLKKFPAEYIYEPWKAPRSIQQAAGCIVGKDYPCPIVQHEVVSKKNILRMKSAYAKRSPDSAESPSKSPNKKQGTA